MSQMDFSDRKALISTARDREPSDPVSITTRRLVGLWGAKARGHHIVARIRRDLTQAGLATDPDFAVGHFDSTIRIVPLARASEPEAQPTSAYLRIDALRSATQGVAVIGPDAKVAEAMTQMMLADYSQLAVTAGPRSIKGAISWESIGRAGLTRPVVHVRDALAPVSPVRRSADLLSLLSQVAEAGFVLVENDDKTLAGLVTAADVTDEFGALAEPFFLIGEVERRLRLLIAGGGFTSEDLSRAAFEEEKTVETADELTLGEVLRLFERPESWPHFEWRVDRTAFLTALDTVREIRNGLMHFSADPPSTDDVALLRNFLALLRSGGE